MPLHLLGKKSWNVYNPTAIAKVRADEAAAAAREEAQNELELEWQADKRLALLRGDPEPPRPKELDEDVVGEDGGQKRKSEEGREAREEKKRMRRRQGENDTDRDLRIAREDAERRAATSERAGTRPVKSDLPLIDAGGHIQLFAPEAAVDKRGHRSNDTRKDPEAAHRQKQQDQFEEGSMRFKEAGGNRSHPASKPWYAGAEISSSRHALSKQNEVGRNAFGKEDPNRKSRDAARVVSADPMQVMMAAQKKLKEVERERERWKEERERETMELEEKSRKRSEGSGHRRRRERSRSREKHGETRRGHRHRRSRSPDCERSRHRSSAGHRHDRERDY